MKNIILYLFLILATLQFCACDLEKEVDINLPVYESKVVVECYLTPGEPYRLLLQESDNYLEPINTPLNIQDFLIDGATVTIKRGEEVIELTNTYFFNPDSEKFFNYTSNDIVPVDYESIFTLEITDESGRSVSSQTQILKPIYLDSLATIFNEKDKAYALASFTDDPNTTDFYRYFLHKSSLFNESELAFSIDDDFVDKENEILIGTGYDYEEGDTLISTLFHIQEDYYDYLESVEDAVGANLNPFGQPASIKSNIEGGIGIFTAFPLVRDTLIIER